MNRHLSSEEISWLILGEHSLGTEQHLENCSICRANVNQFKLSLSVFRESAHHWADRQHPSEMQTIQRIRQAPYRSLLSAVSVVAVAAVVCLFAMLSVGHHTTAPVITESTVDDAVLLKTIDGQLSTTLPTSLTPLGRALSWENTTTTSGVFR